MTFEVWCHAQGADVRQTTPYHVMMWLRQIAPLGAAYCWRELQKVSEAFASVGLSDPTLSPLVIGEFDKIAPLPPPRGWTAAEIAAWSRLPHDIRKVIYARRDQDTRAVRKCQELNAYLKKYGHASEAVLELEKEMRNHATHPTTARNAPRAH